MDIKSSEFYPLIQAAAAKFSIDENLICAIIMTESSGNPWVTRIEPRWKYFYFVRETASNLPITVETETICQSMSWGLLQIMGSVARELGYKDLLTKLLTPEVGIYWGALKIKHLDTRYGSNESDVIASYNAGSVMKTTGKMYVNQGYVDKVYNNLLILRKLK